MKNQANTSVRKQAAGAIERIEELTGRVGNIEEALQQIILAVNQRLGVNQNQISHVTEITDAVVSVLGEEIVTNAVAANRIERAVEEAKALAAKVQKSLENGNLVKSESITDMTPDEKGQALPGAEGSFVEGVELTAEGEEIPPYYVLLRMQEIRPETRALLAGKGVGTEVPTFKYEKGALVRDEAGQPVTSGGKFIVRGIYDIAQKKSELPPDAVKPVNEPDVNAPPPPSDSVATSEPSAE